MWGRVYKASRHIDRSIGRPIGATNNSEAALGCVTALAFMFILGMLILAFA